MYHTTQNQQSPKMSNDYENSGSSLLNPIIVDDIEYLSNIIYKPKRPYYFPNDFTPAMSHTYIHNQYKRFIRHYIEYYEHVRDFNITSFYQGCAQLVVNIAVARLFGRKKVEERNICIRRAKVKSFIKGKIADNFTEIDIFGKKKIVSCDVVTNVIACKVASYLK